ncbi:uncharacterized protein V1516DRAFT_681881, partial [Lipomyces oligophaga]|uniref:uncharacterized protein n=1 Tax=Lipomyces oligophaga TaxID=45792 RepID=UPI0034CE3D35
MTDSVDVGRPPKCRCLGLSRGLHNSEYITKVDKREKNQFDLDLVDLPREVLYLIFSQLSTKELTVLRLVCRKFKTIASENALWKPRILENWHGRAAMAFFQTLNLVAAVSFDLISDGWFRAHVAVTTVLNSKWLRKRTDLTSCRWRVHMKTGVRSYDFVENECEEEASSIISFLNNGRVLQIKGLPILAPFQWRTNSTLTMVSVSAYPSWIVARERRSWNRMLINRIGIIQSNEPGFFDAIVDIHEEIYREINQNSTVLKEYGHVRHLRDELADRNRIKFQQEVDLAWQKYVQTHPEEAI